MTKTGAWLAVQAIKNVGIKDVFGIPGVHTTELFDELAVDNAVNPHLVGHECNGAFMADGYYRASGKMAGLVLVPGAGLTHAASGIAEASLDGIPVLIIVASVREDLDKHYQLHQIDVLSGFEGITKAIHRVSSHQDIQSTLYQAFRDAFDQTPGPVIVEIPVDLLLFKGEVNALSTFVEAEVCVPVAPEDIDFALRLIEESKSPGIFVGWGAVDAVEEVKALAERLNAPVATTLQGISSFPANHPLHVGFGFGESAVPAAKEAFKNCDCLIAIGTRFSEIATGSYGVTVPDALIHIDINPEVFNKNYPAKVALCGDSKHILERILQQINTLTQRQDDGLRTRIEKAKASYKDSWNEHRSNQKVNPGHFFAQIRSFLTQDDVLVCDDGNHTFLTAELMPIYKPRTFISPTDFNAMGYGLPAAIGARIARSSHRVVAIIGDGAFRMSGMELATAHALGHPILCFVFNDGELGQISQMQQQAYNHAPCTKLPAMDYEAFAQAVGAKFVSIDSTDSCEQGIMKAIRLLDDKNVVLVDVNIDYEKQTAFTQGVMATNFGRLDLSNKLRMATRVVKRHLFKVTQ